MNTKDMCRTRAFRRITFPNDERIEPEYRGKTLLVTFSWNEETGIDSGFVGLGGAPALHGYAREWALSSY